MSINRVPSFFQQNLPLVAVVTIFLLVMVAGSSKAAVSPSRQDIYRLAGQPEVSVDDRVCQIRGAFWREGFGPVSDKRIALIDQSGMQIAVVTTDKRGIYETSIQLPDGKGMMLKEGDVFETGISAGIRRSIEIKRNGGANARPKIFNPTIACLKATVEIGTIEMVKSVMDRPK